MSTGDGDPRVELAEPPLPDVGCAVVNPLVSLLLGGTWRDGHAQAHRDPDVVAGHVRGFVDAEGIDRARRIGVRIGGEELPDGETLAADVEGLVAIEISLVD